MSVYDLMVKRRSVRVFKDQKVPEHIVEKLMDAAHNCPSGGNFQPLSIIIVQEGEGREELGRLFEKRRKFKQIMLNQKSIARKTQGKNYLW